jgi:hypothetical protein
MTGFSFRDVELSDSDVCTFRTLYFVASTRSRTNDSLISLCLQYSHANTVIGDRISKNFIIHSKVDIRSAF